MKARAVAAATVLLLLSMKQQLCGAAALQSTHDVGSPPFPGTSQFCAGANCSVFSGEGAMTDEGVAIGIDYYTCSALDDHDNEAWCSFEERQNCCSLLDMEKIPGNSVDWRPSKYLGAGSKSPDINNEGAPVGNYVYLQAFFTEQMVNRKAIVHLRPRNAIWDGWCLAFRFLMNGRSVGSLKVYRVVDGRYDSPSLLWATYGPHGAQWLQAVINVTASDVPADSSVQVILEGVLGRVVPGYFAADMALDDLSWSTGRCTPSVLAVATTTTATITARPCRWGWAWNAQTTSMMWTCS